MNKKLCGESKREKNNNERKWNEFEEEIDNEKIEFSQENAAENSFKVDSRFALIPYWVLTNLIFLLKNQKKNWMD